MGQCMETVVLWSEGIFFLFFSIKTTGLQNENVQSSECNLESNFMGYSTLMAVILGCQKDKDTVFGSWFYS